MALMLTSDGWQHLAGAASWGNGIEYGKSPNEPWGRIAHLRLAGVTYYRSNANQWTGNRPSIRMKEGTHRMLALKQRSQSFRQSPHPFDHGFRRQSSISNPQRTSGGIAERTTWHHGDTVIADQCFDKFQIRLVGF